LGGIDNFSRQNRHSSRNRRSADSNPSETYLNAQQQAQRRVAPKQIQGGSVVPDFSSRRTSAPSTQASAQARSHSKNVFQSGSTVTVVVEPSPSNTPAPPMVCSVGNGLDSSSILDSIQEDRYTQQLNAMLQAGRASAPPQLFQSQSRELIATKMFHDHRERQKQQRMIPPMQKGSPGIVSPTRTPIPSFNNSPANFAGQLPSSSTPQLPVQEDPALKELAPFVWESSNGSSGVKLYPSRALAIFGISSLQLSEVKSTCEAFGSLLYFRSEFFASKGVVFVAYHDLRSARHAAGELKSYLQEMIAGSDDVQLSPTTYEVKVLYCVSLTSSSERNDSILVISNLPSAVRDKDLNDLLASTYGALRSVQSEASGCYSVEFYDIQDASQAMLEIQSTAPWGSSATVSSKLRQDYERKRGQDLFALIGRWRQGAKQNVPPAPYRSSAPGAPNVIPAIVSAPPYTPHLLPPSPTASSQDSRHSSGQTHSTSSSTPSMSYQPTTQLVVGPDGQYSYIMVQPPQAYHPAVTNPQYGAAHHPPMQSAQQHVVAGPHGTYHVPPTYDGQGYWMPQPHHPMSNGPPSLPSYHPEQGHHPMSNPPPPSTYHQPIIDMRHGHVHGHSIPMYAPAVDSSISSGASTTNNSKRSSVQVKQDESHEHLLLDIESVKRGSDTRTSLMVRNIPNKYTHSMLLSEFQESGHGPGTIDFFYLPIDFRNKCNRGYAFINFGDYRDIVSFFNTYDGKSWKIFKSEKICCITYARIQGKDGMMKRFQNSALMEKDQEYRPLVFSPNGEVIVDDLST